MRNPSLRRNSQLRMTMSGKPDRLRTQDIDKGTKRSVGLHGADAVNRLLARWAEFKLFANARRNALLTE